jgi:ClpP class serine protease
VENWDDLIAGGDVGKIQDRLQRELSGLLRTWRRPLRGYSLVILYKRGRIDSTDTDKLFQALQEIDPNKRNNVLLIIESGSGDPKSGYQIGKLCREWAADKFMVAVPRHAKFAATMISLGADQVHMGLLSEMGPVDPDNVYAITPLRFTLTIQLPS